MKVLASFDCNKVVKNKGDVLTADDLNAIGSSLEHLVKAGCLEASEPVLQMANVEEDFGEVEVVEEDGMPPAYKKKKGKK